MSTERQISVQLLEDFRLTDSGAHVPVPPSAATVIAFLAIHHRPVGRSVVAGTLWPDTDEVRALACLRAALHRIDIPRPVVLSDGHRLGLAPDVAVDLHEASRLAHTVARGPAIPGDLFAVVRTLSAEPLRDWEQVWVEPERERFRHLRMSALAELAARLSSVGRHAEAVETAQAALAAEPASESAERSLIAALLAEGNRAIAIRELSSFRRRLWRELRVRPSDDLERQVLGSPHL